CAALPKQQRSHPAPSLSWPRPIRFSHSSPPRRSSDLDALRRLHRREPFERVAGVAALPLRLRVDREARRDRGQQACEQSCTGYRSEEHTSELQSRENLGCRLLLEKKNPY